VSRIIRVAHSTSSLTSFQAKSSISSSRERNAQPTILTEKNVFFGIDIVEGLKGIFILKLCQNQANYFTVYTRGGQMAQK